MTCKFVILCLPEVMLVVPVCEPRLVSLKPADTRGTRHIVHSNGGGISSFGIKNVRTHFQHSVRIMHTAS